MHLFWANDDTFVASSCIVLQLILGVGVYKFVINAHQFDDALFNPLLDDVDLDLKEKLVSD